MINWFFRKMKIKRGQIWKCTCPFEDRYIRILYLKHSWIRYYHCDEEGNHYSLRWDVMHTKRFREEFAFLKYYVKPKEEEDEKVLMQC